jgi:hypothetical protein
VDRGELVSFCNFCGSFRDGLDVVLGVALLQGSDTDIHVVRVELSTESDLFFLYSHTCDLDSFHAMQEQQKLMVDFADYANVLIRMLNNCIKEPHNHLAVYLMQADGRARLDFIQNMEYKFIELLSVDFMRASEDTIRQHITFRYTSMKSRLQVLQTRLHVRPKPIQMHRKQLTGCMSLVWLRRSTVSSRPRTRPYCCRYIRSNLARLESLSLTCVSPASKGRPVAFVVPEPLPHALKAAQPAVFPLTAQSQFRLATLLLLIVRVYSKH